LDIVSVDALVVNSVEWTAALLAAALVGRMADCWVALTAGRWAVWWADLLVAALVDWMAASKVVSLAVLTAVRLVSESDLQMVASLAVHWDAVMD